MKDRYKGAGMNGALKSIEMANLVCRFGDSVLLDHFDDIVYQSFFDEDLVRTYSETSYFFEKVDLIHLESEAGSDVLGIVGRFIKDTKLRREQIYVEGEGLKRAPRSMQSSPSALFLLVLNSHRLIYLKETADAPTKDAFRSTLLSFLRKKHSHLLKSQLSEIDALDINRDEKRERKDQLRDELPRPTLELIALTSEEGIEEFIRAYDVLNQIKIRFSDRNDEADLDEFFNQLQKSKDAIGSIDTALVHRSKEGLDKEQAVRQVVAATAQGNQSVTLRGVDDGGETIVGNNEKFQLKVPLEDVSDEPVEAGRQMYESFKALVDRGLVVLPQESNRTKRLVRAILKRYFV